MKSEVFPLSWPQGYPVTDRRQDSKFICTLSQARAGILRELQLLNAREVIVSTNNKPGRDGGLDGRLIYSNPGVAVYFKFKGEEKVVACDKWKYLHENMRAVEKSIEAIRGLERWGCSDIISRAMGDMKALPQNAGESSAAWWQILQVDQHASRSYIDAAYKQMIKVYHPDKPTGNADMFNLVQKAYIEATSK